MNDRSTNKNSKKITRPAYKLPEDIHLALVIFTLAGSLTLAVLAKAASMLAKAESPPLVLFALTGLVMVLSTAALFAYLNRAGLPIRQTAMTLACGYAGVVAAIKFGLAPAALYNLSNSEALTVNSPLDPNTMGYYIVVGLGVLLLYVIVFRGIYKHYLKRYASQVSKEQAVPSYARRIVRAIAKFVGYLILISIAFLALSVGVIFGFPALEYVSYVFEGLGVWVLLALLVAIIWACMGFSDTTKQAVAIKNPTAIAAFFWLGIGIVLAYHVMWIVFMVTLVQLWPFNTYTPK